MNQLIAIALAAAIVVLIVVLVKVSGNKGKTERTASELVVITEN